jgi:hypothetical protein
MDRFGQRRLATPELRGEKRSQGSRPRAGSGTVPSTIGTAHLAGFPRAGALLF